MSKLPKPLFDNVIVLPDKEEKKESGWSAPDEIKTKPKTGKVVAVGKGVQTPETGVWVEMQVKVGDTVSLSAFKGNTLTIDDTDYIILKQSEIQLIF